MRAVMVLFPTPSSPEARRGWGVGNRRHTGKCGAELISRAGAVRIREADAAGAGAMPLPAGGINKASIFFF
jgi:hypothetical protein